MFEGKPPAERPLSLDPNCAKKWDELRGDEEKTTKHFVVSNEGGLADVLVWLKRVPAGDWPLPSEPHKMSIKACFYEPYVSAARAGQPIHVFSADGAMHNVHPTPRVAGNSEANRAMLPNGAPVKFVFAQPELFLRFKGDVHPWEYAYVSIFDHPFFAVTDKNGRFRFSQPPAGSYELRFAHRKLPEAGVQLKVDRGSNLAVDAVLRSSANGRGGPRVSVKRIGVDSN